jgi:ribosomal protein S18 acetylase RimI-like enzyme
MNFGSFQIRPAEPADRAAAYNVCLKTGNAGQDATASYDDPEALGRIYVGPYLAFEPALSFLAQDDAGVCGYVLGALDSKRFYQRYLAEWLPEIQRAFPKPPGDPEQLSPTLRAYYDYHHPEIYYPEPYETYPSHLHIDLVERAQGRGLGRVMIELLLEQLRRQGSPGVHLAMNPANTRAEHFYRKLGFGQLAITGSGAFATLYMGRTL